MHDLTAQEKNLLEHLMAELRKVIHEEIEQALKPKTGNKRAESPSR